MGLYRAGNWGHLGVCLAAQLCFLSDALVLYVKVNWPPKTMHLIFRVMSGTDNPLPGFELGIKSYARKSKQWRRSIKFMAGKLSSTLIRQVQACIYILICFWVLSGYILNSHLPLSIDNQLTHNVFITLLESFTELVWDKRCSNVAATFDQIYFVSQCRWHGFAIERSNCIYL